MDPRSANPASGGIQPDASFMQKDGTAGPGRGVRHTTPEKYVCVHPGCEKFNWSNEVLLDRHIKTHFPTQLDTPPTIALGSDQGYQAACGSSTAEPTSTTPIHKVDFVHYWTPDNPSDRASSSSTPPAKHFACNHEGCSSSFDRRSDLKRHVKIHQEGPRPFNCFADGCKRKGSNGFMREDKFREHVTNQHLFSDFDIYIKNPRAGNSTGNTTTDFYRFQSWREARRDWQAKHLSDEMPPWLTGDPWLPYWWSGHLYSVDVLKCRQCYPSKRYDMRGLRDHWQTIHQSLETPLWMTIDKLAEWVGVPGLE